MRRTTIQRLNPATPNDINSQQKKSGNMLPFDKRKRQIYPFAEGL